MIGFAEIAKTISEVVKSSFHIPKFAENIKPKYIKDSKEADQKLSINESISLNEEQKNQIKEETGWPDGIVDYIKSWEQYEVYKEANLHESEVNGRTCLIKDIDFDYIDEKTGLTNKERMEKGLSPIDSKTGEKIELHHMGQSFDSPFAELTENSEHGGKNHSKLHDNNISSWRRDPELKNQYQNRDKPNHWKNRANKGE